MSFSLYCLIAEKNSNFNIEKLFVDLGVYFLKTENFQIDFEVDPFDSSGKNLLLKWGEWWIRVFYENGDDVVSDCEFISKYADPSIMKQLKKIDSRIRVLFADDDDRSHTNQIIFMTDFLEGKKNLLIFDPQNKRFVL